MEPTPEDEEMRNIDSKLPQNFNPLGTLESMLSICSNCFEVLLIHYLITFEYYAQLTSPFYAFLGI